MTFDVATLTVSPTASAFPNTPIGSDSPVQKFTLSNIGYEATGPISHVIDGANSPEFVITGSTCGQPLGYNATCEVSVVFRPISAGSKSARLTVSATPGNMFSVILNASSTSPASARLSPTVWDFAPVSIPTPSMPMPMATTGMFTVSNNGGVQIGPLTAIIEGADADSFALSDDACTGALIPAGQSCNMTVRFKPTTAGAKSGLLTVTGPAITLPSATLSGTGNEPAKLTITPMSQTFGDVPLMMKSAFTFDVRNDGAEDTGKISYTLEGVSISEFAVTADATCEMPLKPTDSCGVTVTFSPILPGKKTVSLRIAASPGGFARIELQANAVPMTTQGLISIMSPATDPFGSVTLGDSSSGFFVVRNDGNTATGKPVPTITGTNSTEFTLTDSSCPDTLPISGVCTVSVRFTPTVVGIRRASLQIYAPPSGFATVTLMANAVSGAQLRMNTSSRSFGSRKVNSTTAFPTPQIFTLTNIGPPSGPVNVVIEGPDAADFQIVQNFCQNASLQQNSGGCTVSVRFNPLTVGSKLANLRASATPGGSAYATLTGTGTP